MAGNDTAPAAGTIREAMLPMPARGRQRLAELLDPAETEPLAHDPDPRIHCAIAATTGDVALLRRLAADPHGRVRRAASNRVYLCLGV